NRTPATPAVAVAAAVTVTEPYTVVPVCGAVTITNTGASIPATTPAVAASTASMSAPMSLPSVPAPLYALEAVRREVPPARSTTPTAASGAGKRLWGGS